MDEWYYQRGETTFGPISGEVLHSLLKRNRLLPDTPVRRSEEAPWTPAAQVLAALPPVPETSPPEQAPEAGGPHYDSSLPGAAEVYAPPRAASLTMPPPRLPGVLWFGVFLQLAVFAYTACSFVSFTLIHLSLASDPSTWPKWLNQFAVWLVAILDSRHLEISMLAGFLTMVIWQGCAFASLRELYGDMVRRSRISGLWWIVPFANLAMPLLCLRDMRYLSRQKRDFLNSHASFGPLLITFEVLLLLRMPMAVLTSVIVRYDKDGIPSGGQVFMLLFNGLCLFAFATVLMLIVVTNFRQQRRLFAHWDDTAFWDKHRQG